LLSLYYTTNNNNNINSNSLPQLTQFCYYIIQSKSYDKVIDFYNTCCKKNISIISLLVYNVEVFTSVRNK